MVSRRVERVGKLIREELSQIIFRELKDPRVGMVEITQVKVSSDLAEARVFFRVVGEEDRREVVEGVLIKARGFIQGQLGRRVGFKVIPNIRFEYDVSLEDAIRIEKLLDGAKVS